LQSTETLVVFASCISVAITTCFGFWYLQRRRNRGRGKDASTMSTSNIDTGTISYRARTRMGERYLSKAASTTSLELGASPILEPSIPFEEERVSSHTTSMTELGSNSFSDLLSRQKSKFKQDSFGPIFHGSIGHVPIQNRQFLRIGIDVRPLQKIEGVDYEIAMADILSLTVRERERSEKATILFRDIQLQTFQNELALMQKFQSIDSVPTVTMT
jgi:hypothetical protein